MLKRDHSADIRLFLSLFSEFVHSDLLMINMFTGVSLSICLKQNEKILLPFEIRQDLGMF